LKETTVGKRGPVPKRSSERRRRNKESKTQTAPAQSGAVVKRPPVSSHWHPIAKSWFKALDDSGQSQFFEPSDWQAARYVAEFMTRHLKGNRPSAQLFAAIWAAMTDLLTTEGARRRVRLEIERDSGEEKPPAGVTALADYREKLGAN
jgi:hypothetical protein